MRVGQVSVQLGLWLVLTGGLIGVATDVQAEERSPLPTASPLTKGKTPLPTASPLTKGKTPLPTASPLTKGGMRGVVRVRDLKQPATTVKQWVAQMEAAQVQVTNVKLERTEAGLDIVLETAEGKPLTIDATKFRREGNSLIAEIPNATLALPQGQTFVADNPTTDIATVQVEQQAGNIRVSVAGNNALPKTEVTLKTGGLAYSLNPEGDEADDEIVVTGEGQRGYRVPNTSIGTRTDTPLRDIPQSIQVVPQQVLRDQNATRLEDALRNVSGVTQAFSLPGAVSTFTIRGFAINEGAGSSFLRDGLPDPAAGGVVELPNIERVEVLKGPASVLFGFGSPGGTINLVTKQPLLDPFYRVEATLGSYNFYRGAIDFSDGLNPSDTVLYRFNAAYRNSGSFIDFFESEYLSFSPVLQIKLGERGNLFLEGEYIQTNASFYSGVPVLGSIRSNPNGRIRRDRNFGEPSDQNEQTVSRAGYRLEYQLSEKWSLRNAFRATFRDYEDNLTIPFRLGTDNRTLNRFYREFGVDYNNYSLTTDLTGRFSTGSIKHQIVVGVDLNRFDTRTRYTDFDAPSIDLFNPIYRQPIGDLTTPDSRDISLTDSLGIFIQNQITLANNLKLLLGGRFDTFSQRYELLTNGSESRQSDSAFSPRVGIVYQPIPAISLYASYARSFIPASGTGFFGSDLIFEPQRGTQYEVGIKADISDRLSTTLALYDLTRTNVLTDDPNNPGFSIQTGEQKSRGIELNIAGEILPGWRVFAGYAYTDSEITKDNTFAVGNRLNNVPENSFNLWTTYEIQQGSLQGLGVGIGLFFVGERQGNLANTFQLPSYLRTDAAIFYRRNQLEVSLNLRNLFDVDYFEYGLNLNRVSYGQPFTVQGTVSWKF